MTQHNDDRQPEMPELPAALRDAARDYNTPPELKRTDLDAMWTAIEAKAFRADIGGRVSDRDSSVRTIARRWFSVRSVLSIAATLLIGVAIGRVSTRWSNASATPDVSRRMTQLEAQAVPTLYQATTSRYLGQTAALLVALPAEWRAGGGRADPLLIGRAHDLLLTTRLLMDSPAANDARVRGLLEDLELVLAQVVRLQSGGAQGRSEMELIRQALEQRDVMPRLRTAVADISADN